MDTREGSMKDIIHHDKNHIEIKIGKNETIHYCNFGIVWNKPNITHESMNWKFKDHQKYDFGAEMV